MPLTASGQLAIVVSSDLGALGSKDGAPVVYNWVLPSYRRRCCCRGCAILGLLALKPNRRAAAWLIWLPLGCLFAFSLVRAVTSCRTEQIFSSDVVAALAAGLAAVWLLSNYLRRQLRLLTFLCVCARLGRFQRAGLCVATKLGLPRSNFSWS